MSSFRRSAATEKSGNAGGYVLFFDLGWNLMKRMQNDFLSGIIRG
jgi:hypothetical protein